MNGRFEQMIDQVLRYKPPSKKKKAALKSAKKKKKAKQSNFP